MATNQAPNLQLAGQRIILLRSLEQSNDLKQKLISLGAEVIVLPMIEIVPDLNVLRSIDESFLTDFTSLIFTSANAVNVFFNALKQSKLPLRLIETKEIVAIGPKTKEALHLQGIISCTMPEKFVAEEILNLFPDDLRLKRILIPAAAGARKVLMEGLENRGAHVKMLPIYHNVMPANTPNVSIENGDFIVFTSPSTANHFFQTNLYSPNKTVKAFCIGDITQKAVSKYLDKNIFVAKAALAESLVECMLENK